MSDTDTKPQFSEMEQAAIAWKAQKLFEQEQAQQSKAYVQALRQTGVSADVATTSTVVAYVSANGTFAAMMEKALEEHHKKVTEQAAKDPEFLRAIVKEAAEDEYKSFAGRGLLSRVAYAGATIIAEVATWGHYNSDPVFLEKEKTPDGVDNKFDHGLSFKKGTGLDEADEKRLLGRS